MQYYPPVTEQAGKQKQVARMFDAVAPRYDLVNRIVSLGLDQRWRKIAIRKLGELNEASVLDVATGTGDVALSLMHRNPARVVGVDISEEMLARARAKASQNETGDQLIFVSGRAEDLPFADSSFDAAIVAFGVRNFENLSHGLKEIRRTLRPGAPLVVLEFSRPRVAVVRWGYAVYSRWVLPAIGGVISRVRGAYKYLPDSIRAFPSGRDFLVQMQQAGFVETEESRLTLGIVTVYRAQRGSSV